ncbi:MAG TPA: hypothetical protein VEZ17_03785, partial [Chitinophagaceae bacterium]|nr:hypothetical protein [Chitinophagaceae bacterium]
MKKFLLGMSCLLLLISNLSAQKKSILLEPQTRKINQGDPLPTQSNFDIQVPVSSQTGIIRVNVFKGNNSSDVIQTNVWTRPVNFTGEFAELPFDVRLKNNSKYGFDVLIYTLLSDTEKVALNELVHQGLINYLNASMEATSKGIDVEKDAERLVNDLNAVVRKSLTWYRNTQQRQFEGFSDIVKLKIQQIERARLNNAKFNVVRNSGDSLLTQEEVKARYANRLMDEVQQVVLGEVDNYLSLDFVKLSDSFVIPNRITERAQTVLPLFVGYGGVYLGGSLKNLEYDSQPYAGLSFPLGRGTESHYGRTSFILGIFLSNLKDAAGGTVTG